MKILGTLIAIGLLIVSGFGAVAEIDNADQRFSTENVAFSELVISDKGDYVSVDFPEATSMSWDEGKPSLPVVTKVYTYPFGTRIKDVDVTFSDFVEFDISKLVEPSAETQFATMQVSNRLINHNSEISYSDIDIYPDVKFDYRAAAGLKDGENVIFLTITLYPVEYSPNENKLYYSEKASVFISYIPPANPVVFPNEYDLLIITPSEFESALQRLVDHKNSLNPPVRTIVTTLDEIPSVGVDEQESIKYYIKDAKETLGVSYVLLVGSGWKDNELFPVRYAWIGSAPYEDNFPTDLYYADFYNATGDFSDWDYDNDGKFAEYPVDKKAIDLLPDIYLGKLPCNDVAQLNVVIDKIIYYKEHNKMTNKVVLMGADSHAGDPIYEGEYGNEEVLKKLPGYTPTRLWGSNGELTKQNIVKGFRDNVDFMDFSGHGSPMGWSSHAPDDNDVWIPPKTLISPYTGFSTYDIRVYNVNNAKKFPVVTFTACSNNKYTEVQNCIGWYLVSWEGGGSIATFAESGIGIFQIGSPFVDRLIGYMEVKVHEQMFNVKVLGQVWANCITDYYNNFDTLKKEDYKTMIEWCMIGEPTTAIQDGDDPRIRSINELELQLGLFERFPILHFFLHRLRLL
jgi:hypothetical protein